MENNTNPAPAAESKNVGQTPQVPAAPGTDSTQLYNQALEEAQRRFDTTFKNYLKTQGVDGDNLKELLAKHEAEKLTPEKEIATLKDKFAKLQKEHEDYKTTVETKDKVRLIEDNLTQAKLKPSLKSLVAKEFDITKLEIVDGGIKDWDSLLKPVKEKYKEFFGEVVTVGATPAPKQLTTPVADDFTESFRKALKN